MAYRQQTQWHDNWSANWPGHPRLGGLHGFTDHVVITRHVPGERAGLYRIALCAGPEVLDMCCGNTDAWYCYAVQDDFGNLVKVQ